MKISNNFKVIFLSICLLFLRCDYFPKKSFNKQSEFKLVSGVTVSDLSGIKEGYSVRVSEKGYSVFTINISAENLEKVFLGLSELIEIPGFAIIEIPTNEKIELDIQKTDIDLFHNDVYYWDEITYEQFLSFFYKYLKYLIEDGEINFGFGSHHGMDEVFIGRYKIMTIFSDNPTKYINTLEKLGFNRFDSLKTVWSNFTEMNPGTTKLIKIDDKSIYDLIDELLEMGFYFAECRKS